MSGADAVPPDTKDWTWVLDRPCEECGYDASTVAIADLPHRLRTNAVVWLALMGDPEVAVRPRPDVWSPLEYAAHVHDVHQLFHERATSMIVEHEPHFANWDQDATAVERRYDQQVPAIIGPTLVASAYAVADVYASVPDDDWGRKGVRSDGSVFNLASLGRYHLHDVEHHLHDVSYLADRVTAAAYDAHAEDYAAGTSAMPDEVNANMVRFVDAVGTEARVLEIGTGPGRDAMEMERIGLSVRRTDVSEGFVSRLHAAGYVADRLDPLTDDLTDPLRGGAPYDGVWANASLLHVRRELLPAVLERLAAVTRPGGALHVTLKGGEGARWSVHGNVSAPRYFTFWREDALREVLTAAGWLVDDVEHGESTPADRPSEEWLAVFATRAPGDAED
jgi:protein-L-isoaspartate O-methyltransferase